MIIILFFFSKEERKKNEFVKIRYYRIGEELSNKTLPFKVIKNKDFKDLWSIIQKSTRVHKDQNGNSIKKITVYKISDVQMEEIENFYYRYLMAYID